MEDRRASFMAAAFGSVAIGGFWFVRPTSGAPTLRVVQQTDVPPGAVGPDADAAVVFRVKPPAALREMDGAAIVYQIVDRKGRAYPLMPMSDSQFPDALKLPVGYARRPEGARLQVLADGRPLAECAVRDLPPPRDQGLVPDPDSPVDLVYRGGPGPYVEPRRPVPRNERWRIDARSTRYAPDVLAVAELPMRMPLSPGGRLTLPYPEEAEAVELEIARYRLDRESVVVRLEGARLLHRLGGTALSVDRTRTVPNALGATIRLPKQYMGPHRLLRREDDRAATLNFFAVPPWTKPGQEPIFRRERGATVEILSPKPEDLGLRELRVGPAIRRAKREPARPLREGPFTATIRITFVRPVLIARDRTVAGVKVAPRPWPKLPSERFFGGFGR